MCATYTAQRFARLSLHAAYTNASRARLKLRLASCEYCLAARILGCSEDVVHALQAISRGDTTGALVCALTT